MRIFSTYSVKVKEQNHIFKDTVNKYCNATDYFIRVCAAEWEAVEKFKGSFERLRYVESLTITTKNRPDVKYDFEKDYYKFPSYLRRSAINEALGKVSSYKSNLHNYEEKIRNDPRCTDKKPRFPRAGRTYPAMYRDNMFVRTGTYTARLKVYTRNTWDWIDVELKKSDVDYIKHHCSTREECVPTLQKRGKEWFLDFGFKEKVKLTEKDVTDRIIIAVDLGINHACVCCAMDAKGTILGRHILSLPKEEDSLRHAVNRIKRAQQHGSRKMPVLWAKAKGINDDIAVKAAQYIIDVAYKYNADIIVFEHLDTNGKKSGSKRQRLHLWNKAYVQDMVSNKAHRVGMRVSTVNAKNTSKLAFDGSGKVERGIDDNYSVCKFRSGKIYNSDLSASYNIGARYFIREILKSMPATAGSDIEAKVPECTKRNTCTLSTLINLNAAISA